MQNWYTFFYCYILLFLVEKCTLVYVVKTILICYESLHENDYLSLKALLSVVLCQYRERNH